MYDLTQLGENTYCFNCFSNVGIYKLNEKDVCLIVAMINHQAKDLCEH